MSHPHGLLFYLAAGVLLLAGPVAEARPAFACGTPATQSMRFCQTRLPIQVRVKDLISRLTIEEKVILLVNNAAGVPRLGIEHYEWWQEALHGVANSPGVKFGGAFPGATSFPQVITSAATFNATLWQLMGQVVSDEARAMYNGGQAGLTYWSPNVNVFRDPRWGRGQETPGEDPMVAARYAAAYVRGLQGAYGGKTGRERLKVAACCKHYTAYDLDNWKGTDRFHFNAKVTQQDLEDTYDVPFRACVTQGKVASVMCSYNQVNGVPTCANPDLLRDTIRGQWHLDGYIVSDCDSVEVMYRYQQYTSTPEQAVADSIKAGLDLDCGPYMAVFTKGALSQGRLNQADVDTALANTLTVQMRLGMYDGDPARQPFGNLGPSDVCTPAHQNLALEAARQGVVLLKNDHGTLPFAAPRLQTLAVIGPNSDVTTTMIGNYAGDACRYVTPLQGIGRYVRTIHQAGCTNVACAGVQPIDAAATAAQGADATVLVMGLDQTMEAETLDRVRLLLPGRQQELVSKVTAASRGPVVLVLMSGGPLDITFAKNDPRIAAILWVGYPGQAGGAAIGDAIFGAFSPGGKLPMTWYPQDFVDKVPMTDMAMRPDPSRGYPGRTYRFYRGPVVYPYGYGLSYTKFVHSIATAPTELFVPLDGKHATYHNSTFSGLTVRVSHARCDDLAMSLEMDVDNVGNYDGSHTVLIFSTPPVPSGTAPQKQLVAFEKVQVPAKSRARVKLDIDGCQDLSFADENGIRRIPIGEHTLQIGDLTRSVSLKAEAPRM